MTPSPETKPEHHVVIVGGGFGGLYAARRLRKAHVRVTLIDRRNFHLFQPLLYQVATGSLSPANIAAPLRAILKYQKNTQVLMAEVCDIDPNQQRVMLTDGELDYDTLVLAAGARHSYFGRDDWERFAPGLKSLEDATEIRRRALMAFEIAERTADPERRKKLLTFVVVGAGPTGVELAGALAEISHHTMKNDFRSINPCDTRIVLVDGSDRVLPPFAPELSASAQTALEKLGIEVRTGGMVSSIDEEGVNIRFGDTIERIETPNVLWAAGVQASKLGNRLASHAPIELDRAGRVVVEANLTVPGHANIFVIGDMANSKGKDGRPLPGVAPVAMQQGNYVAHAIQSRLQGKEPDAFQYWDRGSMATIGRAAAVADLGWAKFTGYIAWWIWLLIHLMYLVQFQNRVLVLMQWSWNYWTRSRSARLITGVFKPRSAPQASPPSEACSAPASNPSADKPSEETAKV